MQLIDKKTSLLHRENAMEMEEDTVIKNRLRRVNIMLNSKHPQSNIEGVILATQSIMEFNSNFAVECFLGWADILSKIAVRCEDTATSNLASFCFAKLMKNITLVPSAAREISSQKIPLITSSLLQFPAKNPLPQLECILTIMKSFPASCGSLKSRITKYLLPLLSSTVVQVQEEAIKCWSLLPYIGPAGMQNIEHSKNWLYQMDEVIYLLENLLLQFLGKNELSNQNEIGLKTLSFEPVPINEPEPSIFLKERLIVLFKCFTKMMNSEFSAPVQIQFHKIIKIFMDILNVSPQEMGHTSEMIERSSYLPLLHEAALSSFTAFILVCEDHCSMHSTTIRKTVLNLLDQTKSTCTRSKIYNFINTWIDNCPTLFMTESDTQSQLIFNHFKHDIQGKTNEMNNCIQNGTPSKKRKKSNILQNSSISLKSTKQQQPLELAANAIVTLTCCIQKLGQRIPSKIHKGCQKITISLLLTSQPHSKLLLFKLLLSLVLNSNISLVPPFPIARYLFELGYKDKNIEVSKFCQHALLVCNSYVYANLSAIHYCGVNLSLLHEERKNESDAILVNGLEQSDKVEEIHVSADDPVNEETEKDDLTNDIQLIISSDEDDGEMMENDVIESEMASTANNKEECEEIETKVAADQIIYSLDDEDSNSANVMFSSVTQNHQEGVFNTIEEGVVEVSSLDEEEDLVMESNDISNMLSDFVNADADVE